MALDRWMDGWVDGWMGGWMGGSKSQVKDCLQQSKIVVLFVTFEILPKYIFRCDRSTDFDERGLRYLSAESSATRHHLQFFHIGVYKHRQ